MVDRVLEHGGEIHARLVDCVGGRGDGGACGMLFFERFGNASAGAGGGVSLRSGGATQPNAQWTPFVNDFISGWFKLDPAFAVYEGKHEFDGQLPDWSNAGLKRRWISSMRRSPRPRPSSELS